MIDCHFRFKSRFTRLGRVEVTATAVTIDTVYAIEIMTRHGDTGDPIDNEGVFPNEAIEDPINPRIIDTWQSRCVNPAGGWLVSNRDPGIIYTRTARKPSESLTTIASLSRGFLRRDERTPGDGEWPTMPGNVDAPIRSVIFN